jgi:hypothetical protein
MRQCNTQINVSHLYYFAAKLPEDGIPVPKYVNG